jgi:hypothetical protein
LTWPDWWPDVIRTWRQPMDYSAAIQNRGEKRQ